MPRCYTAADVDDLFADFRELVTAKSECDPEWVDYTFRMEALIRFWVVEMSTHTVDAETLVDALKTALDWAGFSVSLEVWSGTVH